MLQLKSDNERMARAYSDDLRRKLLEAHQQSEGTLEELAERFRVSLWMGPEDIGGAVPDGSDGTAAWQ